MKIFLFFSMRQMAVAAFSLMLCALTHPVWAECSFTGGGEGVVTFQLPTTIIVDPDAAVGTVLYDGSEQSDEVAYECGGQNEQIYRGYLALTDADARENVLPGVYKTNVTGIGIRSAASSERFPSWSEDDIIRPWHYVGMRHGATSGTAIFRAAAQLVVIGPVEEGYLDTSRLTAKDVLGGVVIGDMRFSPTSVHVTTNTCNLVDRNIYVPLKTVNTQDFDGQYSDVLTDGQFKIEITGCKAGTQVDYQFNSAGSTGVINGNILKIAEGDRAASGVGIQILNKNDAVINFDQQYSAITSASDKEPVDIPLKARYVKTGEIKAGKVDSVATFEVYYR